MAEINVTCIGGGHGLGNLLEIIDDFDFVNLTGIVSTTDNGGSTGRLRESCETISWGDIRYCLSKLNKETSTKSLLFEFRFEKTGDLSGHSLGNLMICAVDSLCIRPTETVQVIRQYLGIKANILPMSDEITQLVSHSTKHCYIGEVDVDEHADQGINKLALTPMVTPSDEVLHTIKNTHVLFLGPGSFYTSILPCLLMAEVIEAINQNTQLKVYFISNVEAEFHNQYDETYYQLEFIRKLGLTKSVHTLIPRHRVSQFIDLCKPYTIAELPANSSGTHHKESLKNQVFNLINS